LTEGCGRADPFEIKQRLMKEANWAKDYNSRKKNKEKAGVLVLPKKKRRMRTIGANTGEGAGRKQRQGGSHGEIPM